MTQTITSDICVIGAGPGGLSASALAASFGASVVLVEKALMGGTSLHSGCIPSKALMAAAKRVHDIRDAPKFGLRVSDVHIDHKAIAAYVQNAVTAVAPNMTVERFNGLGVDVLKGTARFVDKETVAVGESTIIKAKRFIVATGSKPWIPQIPGLDRVSYFTNETIFSNMHRFAHLLILGGSPAAIEFAQAYRRLGSEVTVIEPGSFLQRDDPELRGYVAKALKEEGVRVLENARIQRFEPLGSNIQAVFAIQEKSYAIEGTALLLAIGRTPWHDTLNAEAAGIAISENGITTNGMLRTSNPRVYAIGDVTGALPYTHTANYHASIAVKNALFRMPIKVDHETVPWVTFTDPELAHVGLTEDQARKRFGKLTISRWPYYENDRAHCDLETKGLLKVIATKSGKILGAGVVGPKAGEIIQMWSLAMQKGLSLQAMSTIVSPYPTLAEINKRAALSYVSPQAQEPLLNRMIGLLAR